MAPLEPSHRGDWANPAAAPDTWKGEWQGGAHGAGISVIFFRSETIGGGPRLHTHPYPETFIMRTGRALFTLGDQTVEAVAGDILVAPANTPHKFANLGSGVLESIDIHEAGAFETIWLE